jgi:hypothetical protein
MTVYQFVRFGNEKLSSKAEHGVGLNLSDEEGAELHGRKVAKMVWCLNEQTVTLPSDSSERYLKKGSLLAICRVPFRMSVREKGARDRLSPSVAHLHACWASIRPDDLTFFSVLDLLQGPKTNIWFLTKDGKLSECQTLADVFAVQRADGILYLPDGRTTYLAFVLSPSKAIARRLTEQPGDFKIDLIFDQLEYRQASDWGFYKKDELIEADWNSQVLIDWNSTGAFAPVKDPHYFRPKGVKIPNVVRADLVSAVLKNKEGKEIGSYKRDTSYGEFVTVQQLDETPILGTKERPKQK